MSEPEETPPPKKRPPKYGARGRYDPAKMSKAEKTAKCLALRREGYTFRDIADEIGITLREAHKLVTDEMNKVKVFNNNAAEQLIEEQNMRLELMFRNLRKKIENGETRAIEVGIKILERQSKLHGLDAPVKQEVRHRWEEMNDQELLEEAKRLQLDVKVLPTDSLMLPGETSLPASLMEEIRQVVDAEFEPKEKPDA